MVFCVDDIFLAQLFQFAHHGAAVGADVFGERAERKGERKAHAAGLLCLLVEKAQQLFADGAAGEHLDPLTQVQGFFREKLKEVRHDLTVAGAGVFAPLGDLIVTHKEDAAVLAAGDDGTAVTKAGKGQLLAENAACIHRFEHCTAAVGVQADELGAAREQHADHILLLAAGEDGLPRAETTLVGAEAFEHIPAGLFIHARKKSRIPAVHPSSLPRGRAALPVQHNY